MKIDHSIDKKLIEDYKAGDKRALTLLVKRWHKSFCDKAYWMVKDKDVAKDIAQDSWTTIINNLEKLIEPKQFKYWAYRIVCNKSTDWLRIKSKNQKQSIGYEFEIENDDNKYTDNEQLKLELLKAVSTLSANQKVIVRLFYTEAYSLKQISDLLDISVGTAKSRLFHAREKLKIILKNKNYEN
ncbi:RNA polymerase sigma factor [Winogradskyella sp. PG-2]|uniref:RNA polymerase sigma factor n=1 Tax=Winogradskyella sp. PG-2 TaxID=754409 RepID=UPI0004586368|nr:RNA polymerase sigma factor [Winogradskyella sp. PG-2]BAO77098.1 RNA polymerase ECF-type sigma factor [Winogradskyella sp. PG-2]